MSYEARRANDYQERKDQADRDGIYDGMVQGRGRIESQVQEWMDQGVALLGRTTDATERAELQALRDGMVASLRTILGV